MQTYWSYFKYPATQQMRYPLNAYEVRARKGALYSLRSKEYDLKGFYVHL